MNALRWRWLTIVLLLAGLAAGCDGDEPFGPGLSARVSTAPINLTATAVSHEEIDLAWQDNATNESGWEVHRSTTGPTGTFTLVVQYPWPNVTSAGFTSLQPVTQYCFKVRSYKGSGRRGSYGDFSNVACATTLAAPVPAAPSGVSAAPFFFGSRIRVTWTDNATNESGFRVERSATSSGPWTLVGTTSASVTSFDDSQFPGVEQPACYRVFAFNTFGNSQGSNVDCTAVPAAPSGLAASVSGSSVDLTWTDNSAVEDGFQVERWTATSPIGVVATLPANATGYQDAGLADSTYYYQVKATRDGGTSNGSNNVGAMVITAIPNAPSGLDAVPQSSSVIDVSWIDESANEEGFRFQRSADGGVSWVTAATTGPDATWLEDAGPSEQQLCYRVIAFNHLGDSAPSNTDCTTPPAAPTAFTATGVDSVTVDFAWTDNSAVEDGYLIGIDYGFGYWEFIAFAGPNATSYRFQSDYAYYTTYFVVATKDGGYSDWSNSVIPTRP